ncbi:MAG: hypothetical protein ACK4S0_12990 [Sediminibacterium sp.]
MAKLLYETQIKAVVVLLLVTFSLIDYSCVTERSSIVLPAEIQWSKDGLKWEYFQEVISIPDKNIRAIGKIATNIYYRFSDSVVVRGDTATILTKVYSVMLPPKSYIKSSAIRKGLLEHEQIHFDINELCARKFRKEISERLFPFSEVKFFIYEIHQKYISEMAELNQQYDAEHRDRVFGHDFWQKDLNARISYLEKYKDVEVVIKTLIKH